MITKNLNVDKILEAAAAELEAAMHIAHFEPHVERARRLCSVLAELSEVSKLNSCKVEEVITWKKTE